MRPGIKILITIFRHDLKNKPTSRIFMIFVVDFTMWELVYKYDILVQHMRICVPKSDIKGMDK